MALFDKEEVSQIIAADMPHVQTIAIPFRLYDTYMSHVQTVATLLGVSILHGICITTTLYDYCLIIEVFLTGFICTSVRKQTQRFNRFLQTPSGRIHCDILVVLARVCLGEFKVLKQYTIP